VVSPVPGTRPLQQRISARLQAHVGSSAPVIKYGACMYVCWMSIGVYAFLALVFLISSRKHSKNDELYFDEMYV
jgi:hypothetical protein